MNLIVSFSTNLAMYAYTFPHLLVFSLKTYLQSMGLSPFMQINQVSNMIFKHGVYFGFSWLLTIIRNLDLSQLSYKTLFLYYLIVNSMLVSLRFVSNLIENLQDSIQAFGEFYTYTGQLHQTLSFKALSKTFYYVDLTPTSLMFCE